MGKGGLELVCLFKVLYSMYYQKMSRTSMALHHYHMELPNHN